MKVKRRNTLSHNLCSEFGRHLNVGHILTLIGAEAVEDGASSTISLLLQVQKLWKSVHLVPYPYSYSCRSCARQCIWYHILTLTVAEAVEDSASSTISLLLQLQKLFKTVHLVPYPYSYSCRSCGRRCI